MKQLFAIALLMIVLAGCNTRTPITSELLNEFLQENPDSLATLTDAISKQETEIATQTISGFLSDKTKQKYANEWENKTLLLDDYELKFEYKKFGEKPSEGWSLYISMHGGGGAPAALNDQQWQNQIRLYEPEEGIYMAARAPTNTWNLWHQSHIDIFFSRFIQLANIFEGINTNRVYITGYSAGGDGTYQLAPRMADNFAAAAMMAGHPNDASALGLRNLPFAIHMGAEDAAYRRNEIAAEWGEKLDALQKNDPDGYVHDVQIHEGMGHWMERKDTVAIEWMAGFNRNSYPTKVVWKQSGVTHNRFYWLAVPTNKAVKDAEIVAEINGQEITISEASLVDDLYIRLNDEMLDLNQKVTVTYDGREIYSAVPERNVATVWKTLNERNDLNQVFSAEIRVSLK